MKYLKGIGFQSIVSIEFVHIYADFGVVITEIKKGNMSLSGYMNSLNGEKVFAVLSLSDPMPFIAESLLLPYLWITR